MGAKNNKSCGLFLSLYSMSGYYLDTKYSLPYKTNYIIHLTFWPWRLFAFCALNFNKNF